MLGSIDAGTFLLIGGAAGLVLALLFLRQGPTVIYVTAPQLPEPASSEGLGCSGFLFLLLVIAVAAIVVLINL